MKVEIWLCYTVEFRHGPDRAAWPDRALDKILVVSECNEISLLYVFARFYHQL